MNEIITKCLFEFVGTAILVLFGDGVVASTVLKKSKGENGGIVIGDPATGEVISRYTVQEKVSGSPAVDAEKHSSQGRADCIVQTPKYIWIFEFKLDGDAAQALSQIDERGYAKPFAADPRTIIKTGVNFSSKTGTIEGWEM